jgi:hypothetical protein
MRIGRTILQIKANLFGQITVVNGQWNRMVSEPLGWAPNAATVSKVNEAIKTERKLEFELEEFTV